MGGILKKCEDDRNPTYIPTLLSQDVPSIAALLPSVLFFFGDETVDRIFQISLAFPTFELICAVTHVKTSRYVLIY